MGRRSHTTLLPRLLSGLVLTAALTACGGAAAQEIPAPELTDPAVAQPAGGSGAAAGMCAPGVTDCIDTPGLPGTDEYPAAADREAARALLGTAESDLPGDVRIARRGHEQMVLTDDYVLGRFTVALDAGGDEGYVVTEVTVELPDGPETFTPES